MNRGKCTLPGTHSSLQKLWMVMSNKDSVLQVDRQIILLEAFLSQTGDNLNIVDLDLVTRVVLFLVEHEAFIEVYNNYLRRIIDLFKQPPSISKASDELTHKQNLVKYFSTMGCLLLETRHDEYKYTILEILPKIIKVARPKSSSWVPIKACVNAIELSELMDCIVDFITISAGGNMYHLALLTTLQICQQSSFSCWTLLMKSSVDILLLGITTVPSENRRDVLDTSLQLLWTLFFCTSNPEDWLKVPPPSKAALRGLSLILKEICVDKAYPDYDATVNNIAAIALKLMHLFPTAEYVTSGLIRDVAYFITMIENQVESAPQPSLLLPFKSPQTHFLFKKLMLACLSLSPISTLSVDAFKQHKTAECLVKMLSTENHYICNVWRSLEQTIEQYQSALQVICALSDVMQNELIDAGVVTTFISLLQVFYIGKEQPIEDIAYLITEALLALCCRKVITESTLRSLQEEGTVEILLKLCEWKLLSKPFLTIRLQSILCNCFIVSASLMENNTNLQKQHAKSSYNIVSRIYQRILNPNDSDSLIDNRLTVAVANYAWKCIVCNQDNILNLFSSNLICPHIDILDRSLFSVQLVFLTVLCDICEYPQSLEYLSAWRGSRGVTFLQILCRIWRAEEKHLGVLRNNDGSILDSELPLMGEEQFILCTKESSKIMSMCDVFGSARPKIYSIVQLLLRHKEVTTLCDKRLGLGYDILPWEDKVTLQLVEAFLPLKIGEIWWEIKNKQEIVAPLHRYLAHTLSNRYLQWGVCVQRAQQQIISGAQQEEGLSTLTRGAQLTSALEALREVLAVAHSVDRELRLRNWRRCKDTVLSSRPSWSPQTTLDLRPNYRNTILMVNENADMVLQQELDCSDGS